MKILPTLTLSAFLIAPALMAGAESSPIDGWSSKTVNIAYSGNAVKRDDRGVFRPAEALYSGDSTTKGNVAFTCFAGSFAVNVALKPKNLSTLLTNTPDSRRRKIRRPDMTIAGEKIKGEDWIYMPAMNVYQARRKITSRKIYNAVILGDAVTMKSDGSGHQPLNLPPIDDAFRDFGADCNMGRNKAKN